MININVYSSLVLSVSVQIITGLHRPKRKMRQNAVMSCIFYNYVSSSLINEFL